MPIFEDENGFFYDSVKYHSKKKHAFIKQYLDIWVERVKRNQPTLDIADLYASTGLCYCKDAKDSDIEEYKWDGSAVLAAKCLQQYSRGNLLFLNTYNPIEGDLEKQISNLKRVVGCFDRIREKVITSFPIEEAVSEAIRRINPYYPNIWILDPYSASALPWDVVERIIRNQKNYWHNGVEKTRRPELIITLMTFDLQRNINQAPHVIETALGMPESVWRPRFNELMRQETNTRKAIIELYAERLMEFYQKKPIIIEINSTNESNIVFCLILCTDHDAGYYVMTLKGIPEFEDWKITEWSQDAEQIRDIKRLSNEQSFLSKFL